MSFGWSISPPTPGTLVTVPNPSSSSASWTFVGVINDQALMFRELVEFDTLQTTLGFQDVGLGCVVLETVPPDTFGRLRAKVLTPRGVVGWVWINLQPRT